MSTVEHNELQKHYDNLYQQSMERFLADTYEVDQQIDDPTDNRYGITLLIRPSAEVKKRISSFLREMEAIDPAQYYYQEADMHITVMSIISCYPGFSLSSIELSEYSTLIEKSMADIQPFDITFRGLTASPSCILLQGFFHGESLNQLRNNLRDNFRASSLEHSIDKRYAIRTAHSTIVRLRQPFLDKENFIQKVEDYKNFDFGTFAVDNIELVANDWYQREEKVKLLHNFRLGQ